MAGCDDSIRVLIRTSESLLPSHNVGSSVLQLPATQMQTSTTAHNHDFLAKAWWPVSGKPGASSQCCSHDPTSLAPSTLIPKDSYRPFLTHTYLRCPAYSSTLWLQPWSRQRNLRLFLERTTVHQMLGSEVSCNLNKPPSAAYRQAEMLLSNSKRSFTRGTADRCLSRPLMLSAMTSCCIRN